MDTGNLLGDTLVFKTITVKIFIIHNLPIKYALVKKLL